MIAQHIMSHSLFYAAVVTGYLFLLMVTTSPRVWGYTDYPEAIKKKVPPRTKQERRLALVVGAPWLVFVLGFPLFSTYALKSKLGGEIPFLVAFVNLFALFFSATVGDLVILDWFVISKITPRFVMIPGTVKADYKDFSHHYRSHAKSAIVLVLVCIVVSSIAWYF